MSKIRCTLNLMWLIRIIKWPFTCEEMFDGFITSNENCGSVQESGAENSTLAVLNLLGYKFDWVPVKVQWFVSKNRQADRPWNFGHSSDSARCTFGKWPKTNRLAWNCMVYKRTAKSCNTSVSVCNLIASAVAIKDYIFQSITIQCWFYFLSAAKIRFI